MLGESSLERVAAKRPAGAGRERGVVGVSGTLGEQVPRTATVCLVSGVIRCFRPLPRQLTCGPVPRSATAGLQIKR